MGKRYRVPSHPERVVLSDVLPFEVPPTFSNRRFYRFLVDNKLRLSEDFVSWDSDEASTQAIILAMLGRDASARVETQSDGRRCVDGQPSQHTIPFNFRVARADGEYRELSIVHPKNQFLLADFYARFKESIRYYTSSSSFSLRHPVRVSRYEYIDDRLHQTLKNAWRGSVERAGREYESLRSYFVYRKHTNIFKFYESRDYQTLEKSYSHLLKLDVSKCFASLYTHSIAWAVYGKAETKENLAGRKGGKSFGEAFDSIMQKLNYNETNGVVVGPEFSRLFAEVILQRIDRNIRATLFDAHQLEEAQHYEIRRYVDDYFVFVDDPTLKEVITSVVRIELSHFHLHLNKEKELESTAPGITPISVAKLRIRKVIAKKLKPGIAKPSVSSSGFFSTEPGEINPKRLISEYKTIIRETGVEPAGVLNYTLSIVERRLVQVLKRFVKSSPTADGQQELTTRILGILNFAFFVYSTSPRVNPTVKISRIVMALVTFFKNQPFDDTLRRSVLDSVAQELTIQLARTRPTRAIQVENLYLLTALAELGREYLMSEEYLLAYFGIRLNSGKAAFSIPLNYFALSTLFYYTQQRSRYAALRSAAEKHLLERAKTLPRNSSELFVIAIDFAACPFISQNTKKALLKLVGVIDSTQQNNVISRRPFWFTEWQHFDLAEALDRKRNQEVY